MSKKVKGKVQAAPKELLRRGLLTGSEKLKGQLRDAAEGGRREDTEADRAQATARMGARLAVDRLGRMAPGNKRARSWSGEAVSEDTPKADSDSQAPGTPIKPNTPPSDAGPVRIKTRETVHDAPVTGYGRAELPKADQPVVKTKDAYVRRQAVDWGQVRRQTDTVSRPGGFIQAKRCDPVQPMIRTKDSCTRQYGIGLGRVRQGAEPRQISERLTSVPSQAQERGRQRFVQERTRQATERRVKGRSADNITPTLPERHGVADVSRQSPKSGAVHTEALSNPKTVWETRANGKCPIQTARLGRESIGKPNHQKVKSVMGYPKQAAKTAEHSAGTARQMASAAVQAQQRAVRAAGGAKKAAATVGRPVVKAATSALRGAVSAIRTAVAPLAAGGGAVIAVILVLCLVAALIMSPLGILFGGEESDGQTVADAVREINQEYSAKLEDLKSGETYDQLSITGTRALWPEVLAVYAVKTTSDPTNGQEVVTMTDEKKVLLKQVFWDMNQLSSFTSTVPGEGDEESTTTLHITVSAKTADEMADVYGFNASQRQQLTELLSEEYRELWNAVLYGIGTGSG